MQIDADDVEQPYPYYKCCWCEHAITAKLQSMLASSPPENLPPDLPVSSTAVARLPPPTFSASAAQWEELRELLEYSSGFLRKLSLPAICPELLACLKGISISSVSFASVAIPPATFVSSVLPVLLTNSSLTELDLSRTFIQNEGCLALIEALPQLPNLTHLNLDWTDIDDTSFLALAALIATPTCSLTFLDVRWNPASMQGRTAIKRAAAKKKALKVLVV